MAVMSAVLYLFGSGLAFYLGSAMVLSSLVGFTRGARGWKASGLAITARLGIVLAILSAVPLSYWLYGLAIVVTSLWLWSERTNRQWLVERRDPLRLATAVVWVGAGLVELPYHVLPTVPAQSGEPLYVIGDSMTAGMEPDEPTWPARMPIQAPIQNLARVGATTAAALQSQAPQLPATGGILIVEIGGNDLLGGTSSAGFARDLNRLLQAICVPGRTVLMFELALPPLCNEYGRVQRRLAARYGVRLIPKRVLIDVLAGSAATLDSIHLTATGHERMASNVWSILEPAYSDRP
jgi:acyl-CoA thioesterase I